MTKITELNKVDLSGKKIFYAPLNWGLGHATRSMPVIQQLLEWKATVVLGGDGRSFKLLKQEFPNLKAIELPSYDVKYTGNAAMVAITLLRSPKYLWAIKKEHDQLDKLIQKFQFDYVFSDNRYGLWSSKIPCVFICHQIALIPPSYLKWGSLAAYELHKLFFNRFDHIWIPDVEGENNLSGILTHRYPLTDKMAFIGALSRFKNEEIEAVSDEFNEIDIVSVLSGPEPQRTLLEASLIKEFKSIGRKVLLVQGKTEEYIIQKNEHITTVSYLKANQLNVVLQKANVVIARSGYSTIMDLTTLGKRAILIPTPGQTEQEYLANKMNKEGKAIILQQSALKLEKALNQVEKIEGLSRVATDSQLLTKAMRTLFV